MQRLLDAGADPNRQTLYPTSGPVGDVRINPAPPGSSPFHIAADSDCLPLVKMLADKGAKPNLYEERRPHAIFSGRFIDRPDDRERDGRAWEPTCTPSIIQLIISLIP